jgi:hypothetical protein
MTTDRRIMCAQRSIRYVSARQRTRISQRKRLNPAGSAVSNSAARLVERAARQFRIAFALISTSDAGRAIDPGGKPLRNQQCLALTDAGRGRARLRVVRKSSTPAIVICADGPLWSDRQRRVGHSLAFRSMAGARRLRLVCRRRCRGLVRLARDHQVITARRVGGRGNRKLRQQQRCCASQSTRA